VSEEGGDGESVCSDEVLGFCFCVCLFIIYLFLFIYYESTKRKLKTTYICGCRCYEKLQTKTNEFTCLSYTELVLELEHLKIETRLITEMFANVMGECEN
jgi:hypothetical protein